MVASGLLADNIVAHEDPPKEFVHIKHELRSLASQISTSVPSLAFIGLGLGGGVHEMGYR